ncbi:MAG: tRNA pseudouridine(55) synthase TruB [Vicingaceae bacterium]
MNLDPPKGYFLVDKPLMWTSFNVVKKVKFLLKHHHGQKVKIGHAGTLDPLASGLLILCYGPMTKLINEFQDLEKEYTGTIQLGGITPSLDRETKVSETFPTDHISNELIAEKASSMIGIQWQQPPLYSAKWHQGERAYHLARKGEKIELPERQIEIVDFQITGREGLEVHFNVRCSKGTYIRSLARDFGIALNSGAYLKALRRTAIGPHRVESALSIDELIELLKKPEE